MGSITTGTGLISGLDIQDLVTKLMAIEARPINLLNRQIQGLDAERAAYMALSAKLLSLKLSVTPFKSGVSFRPNKAASSNETVLTAKASSGASPGTYTFRASRMVQTHQLVSSGFADSTLSSVGTGTISIEIGHGRLNEDTELSLLNAHQGIRRGVIRITDRNGGSSQVDLRDTLAVSDVIDAINNATGANVQASTQDDRIVITDNTGGTGNLVVEDLFGGHAAEDMGIAGAITGSTLSGSDLIAIAGQTPFKILNDGNSVRTNSLGADFQVKLGSDQDWIDVDLGENLSWDTSIDRLNRGQGVRLGQIKITTRDGTETVVDLSDAQTIKTVGDIQNAITGAANVSVALIGSHLMITDKTSSGDGTLKIANFNGSQTASDLGVEGESAVGQHNINGSNIFAFLATVNDVIQAVSTATGGQVTAQVSSDGKRLELNSQTGYLEVQSYNESHTAEDLGIARLTSTGGTLVGNRLIGGLNTVLLKSLNGGSGVGLGLIDIQDRSGASAQIDVSSAETLDDVLSAINSASGISVRAGLNRAGTGITVTDLTGSTAANLRISDVNSTTAADLHIAIDEAANLVDSGNNQLQYVSETTKLADLNAGRGIGSGSFTLTDSAGGSARIAISTNDVKDMTVGQLLTLINSKTTLKVKATINSTGDGILLTDEGGGAGKLTVQDNGGQTAKDLRLAGSDEKGLGAIDGSYEYRLEVGGTDSLQTIIDRLKELDAPIRATIINDGSEVNGYRLSLTSKISGQAGEMIYNAGGTDLELFEIIRAQDAVLSVGGAGTSNTIVTRSNTNTFSNVIPGLTLEVQGVSDTPVTVTVSQDVDTVVEKVQKFVDDFNAVLDQIDEYSKYDSETEQAGVLLGSMQTDLIRNRLYSAVRKSLSDVGDLQRLSQVGISVGSGAKLQFDEEAFRDLYSKDPESIEKLFSTFDQKGYAAAVAKGGANVDKFYSQTNMGFGYVLDHVLDLLTRNNDGVITHLMDNYDERKTILSDRMDYLKEMMSRKEERLYRQFYNMELALSRMQGMQSALSSFTPIVPMNTNTGSNGTSQ